MRLGDRAAWGAVALAIASVVGAQEYRLIDAGLGDHLGSYVGGLSPGGRAGGGLVLRTNFTYDPVSGVQHYDDLLSSYGDSATLMSYSDTGLATGYIYIDGRLDAFLYDFVGSPQFLGLPGGVNEGVQLRSSASRTLVGLVLGSLDDYAFIWSPGVGLVRSGGIYSDVNDSDLIVGARGPWSERAATSFDLSGNPTDLPAVTGATTSEAMGVSESGLIVGHARIGGITQPVLWTPGGPVLLDAPSGAGAIPRDVNSAGLVVGRSGLGATLWDADGTAHALSDLLVAGSDPRWLLGIPTSIAEDGTILADAYFDGEENHRTIILKPVPEPATLLVLSAGLLFAIRRRRRPEA